MGIFNATSKNAETPDIFEEGATSGMFDLRFDSTTPKRVKGGQYTKDTVNGDPKLEWNFTVLDDAGEVLYFGGDPVEVSKLTGVNFNIASKTMGGELKVLKALSTPAEYAKFEAGDGTDEESLKGRVVQAELFINPNGFLAVGEVIKARAKRASK